MRERPRTASADAVRADLRRALAAGEPVSDEIVDRLVLPLVAEAVPEWHASLHALPPLPEIGGPVGYAGGGIAIGTRLAVVEPRIAAAVLFAGSFVPRGGPEVLDIVDLPDPVPGDGEQLHEVSSAGIDYADTTTRCRWTHLSRHAW